MAEINRVTLFGKLNAPTYKTIEGATVFCKLRGNPYVELEHWIAQLLQSNDTDWHRVIKHAQLDMSVLAEVHDRRELDRALALETRLIGVNNRNLKTLVTDLATTDELVPLIPADRIPVSESGIRTPDDVRRICKAGARCLLVGEHLLRQPDVTAAASALIHAIPG